MEELKVPNTEPTKNMKAIKIREENNISNKKKRKKVIKKIKKTIKSTIVIIGMLFTLGLLVNIKHLLNPTTEEEIAKISNDWEDSLKNSNETLEKALENINKVISEKFSENTSVELSNIKRPNAARNDWQYPVNDFNYIPVVFNSLQSLGISPEKATEIYNNLTEDERQLICAYCIYYKVDKPGEFMVRFAGDLSQEYKGEEFKEKLTEEYNRILAKISKEVLIAKTGRVITGEYNGETIMMSEDATVIMDETGNIQVFNKENSDSASLEQTSGRGR